MRECLRFIRQTATGGNKEQKYLYCQLADWNMTYCAGSNRFLFAFVCLDSELIGEEDLLTFFDWNFNVKYHGIRLSRRKLSVKICVDFEIHTRNPYVGTLFSECD